MSVSVRGESEITANILRNKRQYFVKKVKAPFLNSLVRCFQRGSSLLEKLRLLADIWHLVSSILKYPEPTKENTKKQISHVLLDIWDEFFSKDTSKCRTVFFRICRRISVITVEHDDDYSQRITWFLMKLATKYLTGDWPPLESWCPMNNWNDYDTLVALSKARFEFRSNLTIGGRPFNEVET